MVKDDNEIIINKDSVNLEDKVKLITYDAVFNNVADSVMDRGIVVNTFAENASVAILHRLFMNDWLSKVITSSKKDRAAIISVINFFVARGLSRLAIQWILGKDGALEGALKKELINSLFIYGGEYYFM